MDASNVTNDESVDASVPVRPPGFDGVFTGFVFPEGIECPRQLPRTAKYVSTVEWSWSPANSRMNSLYLSTNRSRTHWILWVGYLDDNAIPMRWVYQPYAYGPKSRVSPHTAAYFLLLDAWSGDKRFYETDHFHGVARDGFLMVDELYQIGAQVWPDQMAL